ncbi:MAG: transcriptional regulator PhoU [Moraxellaceae bacterium]|jgi:phosphate transport system protein|nr:transcriptional regulator PhoU [Moraxellaceae bacterium]MDF3031372.1 transcriptional regulator PhoU [Moraxellaceae bacterium]
MVSKSDYGHHISAQFNAELEEVRSHFLAMGGLVEKQVGDAITALLDANSRLAEEVQTNDQQINRMESQIDEELVRILARRQPAASDLRFIIAVGKSLTDLERVGDEAAKVARYALALVEEGESPRGYVEARHIGSQVRAMLHDALDAFARFDADLAFQVMQRDSEIDTEYKTAMRALMTYMMEDPRAISRVLNVMWVLRSLERIGDHARNISEQLIFLVKGADVRHTSYEQVRQRLDAKK